MSVMYHEGNRRLQDKFHSRRISDRLEEKLTHNQFTEGDKTIVEGAAYFFLATADAEGRPDCSFKGGMPGFVRAETKRPVIGTRCSTAFHGPDRSKQQHLLPSAPR
jgi:Pyridoxamine 5'-phosphate oxidase